jgi:hypothetical protein
MLRDHEGVKGAKPRLKMAKEQLPKLSEQYLRIRNRGQRTKAQQSELLLARAREELITKELVTKQAAFLLIQMRQKILNFPSTFARRILGLTDVNQASAILREMAISVLNEIKDLPQAAIDPGWLKKLDADEGK